MADTACIQGRVLIADDDPASRRPMAEILSTQGFECVHVESGPEALAALAESRFDVVIADIVMEGNAGLELVQLLAREHKGLPVVLVTGQPSLETATLAVKLRVIGYLTKPIVADELLRLVRAGVETQTASRFLREHRARLEQMAGIMRQWEEAGQPPVEQDGEDPLSTYLNLSLDHVLISMNDIRDLVKTIVAREGSAEARKRLASTRPFLLLDAIRETISVLERTKNSFKSKDLAELRAKLETLLGQDATKQPRLI